MQERPRAEVLLDGVWCSGEVWDWQKEPDGWWAIVSARLHSGKTYIGKVHQSHVRLFGPVDRRDA